MNSSAKNNPEEVPLHVIHLDQDDPEMQCEKNFKKGLRYSSQKYTGGPKERLLVRPFKW